MRITFILLDPEHQVLGADLECQNDSNVSFLCCCALNCDSIYNWLLFCVWDLDTFDFMILGLHDQCILNIFRFDSVSFDNLSVIKDVRLYFVS